MGKRKKSKTDQFDASDNKRSPLIIKTFVIFRSARAYALTGGNHRQLLREWVEETPKR
ncbi:hypothetical protein SK128_008440, partial [Halocaridina rubra]